MAKGQSENVTQTNKVELTPEQRELISKGMGQIDKSLAGGTPQLPTVPGFDPAQTQAQNQVLDKAGGSLQNTSNNLLTAQNFLLGDVLDVNKNPHLKGAMDAAVRPLTENFQNVVMPALRTEAVQAGPSALNSPKATMRAQQAGTNYMRQVGDTTAQMGNEAYKTGVEAMTRATALAPSSMQAALFPETAMEGVGAQRREMQVAQNSQGFNQQMLPFNLGLQLLGASAGTPGAGSTSTVNPAQPSQNWTQMLGAGLSLASLMAGMPFLA